MITAPAVVAAAPGRSLIKVDGPVAIGADFAEHFLLQYTEGMPMEKVGWGGVSRSTLDRLMDMNTRYHDFVLRTLYYAPDRCVGPGVSHRRHTPAGEFGQGNSRCARQTQDRTVILAGHDANLTWLGGLLRIDWLLPDQTFNATAPGSALLFELHRNRSTGEVRVRAVFAS